MRYVIDAIQIFSSVVVVQVLASAANDFQRILLIKQFATFPKKYTHEQTISALDTYTGVTGVNINWGFMPLSVAYLEVEGRGFDDKPSSFTTVDFYIFFFFFVRFLLDYFTLHNNSNNTSNP